MNVDIEKLTNEILDKKFEKSNSSGYSAEEVDAFFDKVNEYLIAVREEYADVKKENNDLIIQKQELNNEIGRLNNYIKAQEEQLNEYRKEGYSNMRTQNEINDLKKMISDLQKK
jgi:DivIVA domain-containing protein